VTSSRPRLRVAHLGPTGTFSEEAALEHYGDNAELVACRSILEVVERLVAGEVDGALVPVENTQAGAVVESAKALARHGDLLTARHQVRLPVCHQLVSAVGVHIEDITAVTSHPQALAQCGQFLGRNLPSATLEPATSTAAAVIRAAGDHRVAAIASIRAAALHGAVVLAADIQDPGENVTTFAALERTQRALGCRGDSV